MCFSGNVQVSKSNGVKIPSLVPRLPSFFFGMLNEPEKPGDEATRYHPICMHASSLCSRCNSGYELSGVGVRFCQATGSWSGTTPTCTSGTAPTCPAIQCNGTAPACRKEELEEEEDKLVAGDIVFSVILVLLIAAVVALSVTVCICAW